MTDHVGQVVEPRNGATGFAPLDAPREYEARCSCGWSASSLRWSVAVDRLLEHRDEQEGVR
jgi:hypothetical protein